MVQRVDATERGHRARGADEVEAVEREASEQVPRLRGSRREREGLRQRLGGLEPRMTLDEELRLAQADRGVEPVDRVARAAERREERLELAARRGVKPDLERTKVDRREHGLDGVARDERLRDARIACERQRFVAARKPGQALRTQREERKARRVLRRGHDLLIAPLMRKRPQRERGVEARFREDGVAEAAALERDPRAARGRVEIEVVVEPVAHAQVAALLPRQEVRAHALEDGGFGGDGLGNGRLLRRRESRGAERQTGRKGLKQGHAPLSRGARCKRKPFHRTHGTSVARRGPRRIEPAPRERHAVRNRRGAATVFPPCPPSSHQPSSPSPSQHFGPRRLRMTRRQ